MIMKADKGNATVIMEKEDYENKIMTLLRDESTYKKLSRDPTATIQKKNNDIVRKMHEKIVF